MTESVLFRGTLGVFLSLWVGVGSALADGPVVPAGSTGAGGGAGAAGQQPGVFGSMAVPLLAMFAVFYFLVFRPQQKRMKDQQALINNLKYGDEVVTTSGILGKVTGIADKVVTLEVSDNVRFKMLKSQVQQVIKGQIK